MTLGLDQSISRFVRVSSISLYLIFCLLAPLGCLTEQHSTTWLSALQVTALLWPYTLLLALQHWVEPMSPFSFIVADIFGLLLVAVFVEAVLTWWSPDQTNNRILLRLTPFLWYVPLLLVQVAVSALFGALGYPVGE